MHNDSMSVIQLGGFTPACPTIITSRNITITLYIIYISCLHFASYFCKQKKKSAYVILLNTIMCTSKNGWLKLTCIFVKLCPKIKISQFLIQCVMGPREKSTKLSEWWSRYPTTLPNYRTLTTCPSYINASVQVVNNHWARLVDWTGALHVVHLVVAGGIQSLDWNGGLD